MTLRSHRWISLSSAVLALLSYEVLPLSAQAQAQDNRPTTGTIIGRVIDKASGVALQDVGIQVVGLESVGTSTSATGQYTIRSIPAGTVTLQFRRVGYQPKTVTAISLSRGETETVDVTLDAFVVTLTTAVVTAAAERGTVHEAMSEQKTAQGVMSSITAAQIQRSPDGDAAAVVQRASGLTVEDGAAVARGQDGRGTVAFLNNARIPSPDPEKKQVPLDMFPSSLIRTINVHKTFTPNQPGDFSGALVDIQTREFPSSKTVSYSASVGFNQGAMGSDVLASPMSTSEWFAFASGNRGLPGGVRAAGNFTSQQFTQGEMNAMIGSFRRTWTPGLRSASPNSSFSMSVGDQSEFLGREIGYIGALSYSTTQEVRKDEYRALIDLGTGDSPSNEFRGSTGRNGVLWGGLLNVSTFLNGTDMLTFNNIYNRTSDSEARRDIGTDENFGNENILERSTLSYTERSVRSNQLGGKHRLTTRSGLDWAITNSAVTRREPDRADMVYFSGIDVSTQQRLPPVLFHWHPDGARRTFADLSENAWNATSNYRWEFGAAMENNVQIGGLYRYTSRDSEVLQYSLASVRPLSVAEASLPAEEIFDGRYTQGEDRTFTINPLGQNGSYTARDHLGAFYAMTDVGLNQRIRLVAGARGEYNHVNVRTLGAFGSQIGASKDFLDILPSVAINMALSETHNLRLSAARTLARPEYRELSPMLNRDVLGGQGFQGDTSLVRTQINNFDLRWEWYPSGGELVSIALFAKHHDKPLEKIEIPSSGASTLSIVNADEAVNYGLEVELRKDLGTIVQFLSPFTAFGNATFMTSEVRLGANNSASSTNPDRPLGGQAPYMVNAGVTYESASGRLSATMLYNRVGKRIHAAGSIPLPDTYELPRDVFDVALRLPTFAGLDLKLDAKNILDSRHELRQGEVTRLRYTTGRVFTTGLSWKPQ